MGSSFDACIIIQLVVWKHWAVWCCGSDFHRIQNSMIVGLGSVNAEKTWNCHQKNQLGHNWKAITTSTQVYHHLLKQEFVLYFVYPCSFLFRYCYRCRADSGASRTVTGSRKQQHSCNTGFTPGSNYIDIHLYHRYSRSVGCEMATTQKRYVTQ